ncbi:WD40/YVTN/BNR-like repeat-containing protein [Halorussus halophilus]|uniref:WD40/YVTN/BNR-like repeat-containing protein n=1 Tax=Halorussus halophilus TaxID=2650975 RepID=UPI00130140CA|nr:WD40 repeat domain-containing protein [Halorussus halophilus]
MLVAGSDDGVYQLRGVLESGKTTAEKVLDAGRVMRVRQFDAVDGLFVTSETGLYHSHHGDEWTNLAVPEEHVYAVAVDPTGERVYAGTRPAHLYVSDTVQPVGGAVGDDAEWRELESFQALPSRDEWRLPRHENLAQVRSLCTHPDAPDRVVAGVEVGGVHLSDDGGERWEERRQDVHDDIHHLHLAGPDEFVAATGFGLYRSTDAGQSWTRLDDGDDHRYFREAFTHDGVIYAGGAHGSSSTWNEESGYALFEYRDGCLQAVEYPVPDEVPLGWCTVDERVVTATHRGTLLRRSATGWERVGTVPTPGEVGGRYLPLSWFET